MAELAAALQQIGDEYRPGIVVVEIARSFGRSSSNQAHLMFAAGALAHAAAGSRVVTLELVQPAAWYPRENGKLLPRARAMPLLLDRHGTPNEHIAVAQELVEWYLRKHGAEG